MKNLLDTLTIQDWILTAIIAYFITHIILRISDFKKSIKNIKQRQMISMDYKIVDLEKLMAKCYELFPIDTIYFKMDLLCIKTQNQIIAHDLDKIEQMEQL